MQLAKGFIGARWLASDPNGDPLIYTVEIRGVNETEWKLLKDKVTEKYLTWDSTAFPDGEYRLRVTASDAPGNPPGEALTSRMESAPFTIDNTPPKITGLAATRNGGKLQVRWHAADALNNVTKAEYSLDGGDWTVVAPVTRLSDAPELDYELTVDAGAGQNTFNVVFGFRRDFNAEVHVSDAYRLGTQQPGECDRLSRPHHLCGYPRWRRRNPAVPIPNTPRGLRRARWRGLDRAAGHIPRV